MCIRADCCCMLPGSKAGSIVEEVEEVPVPRVMGGIVNALRGSGEGWRYGWSVSCMHACT